ncbi:MAG TPA: tetratricopeptide repeat protein [Nitrospiria bacterium]|nr:tetratricopeptide repeat protein [Nitrospiria bacterium]
MRDSRAGRWNQLVGMVLVLVATGCQQHSSSSSMSAESHPTAGQQTVQAPPSQPSQESPEQDYSLAFIQLNPGSFSMEAIQANKKSIPADPKDDKPQHAEALTQLGHANYMIQRYPTAKDYYARAVHADGKSVEARLGLANCYALMGQVNDSLREVKALLAIDRQNPEALYNEGMLLLYGKQDRTGAKQAWEQLVAAHPDNEWSRYASQRLSRMQG